MNLISPFSQYRSALVSVRIHSSPNLPPCLFKSFPPRFFFPFPLHPTQIVASYPPLFVSLMYFPFSISLLFTLSFLVFVSLLCPLFLLNFSGLLTSSVLSSHFSHFPPIPLLSPLCTLSFCLSVPFLPCSHFPTLFPAYCLSRPFIPSLKCITVI